MAVNFAVMTILHVSCGQTRSRGCCQVDDATGSFQTSGFQLLDSAVSGVAACVLHHFAVHSGERFSMKAVMPSTASAVAARRSSSLLFLSQDSYS